MIKKSFIIITVFFFLSGCGFTPIFNSKNINIKIDKIDYDNLAGLSKEAKSKFKLIKPKTMGQALRIDGITPAAVYILLSHIKRKSIKHIA